MLRIASKNIIAQIILLLSLSLVALMGIYYGHSLLDERNVHLDDLLHNEHIKIELAHLLQQNLLETNIALHDLAQISSEGELHLIMRTINSLRNNRTQYLHVLEQGGTSTDSYPVNFGNEQSVQRNLTYINYHPQRIDAEISALRAKTAELAEKVAELNTLAADKITAAKVHNSPLSADTAQSFKLHYKELEPLLSNLLENSNRLYFNSQHEAQRVNNLTQEFRHTYDRVELATITACIIFLLLTGGLILASSRKTLRELNSYQHALQDTNENLETIVARRTMELEQEVLERKNAQQQLIEANDNLEEKVKERTQDLEEQNHIRQQVQQDLASKERHFRRLIENVSDLITIVDVHGIIQYTSPAAERLLGIKAAEMVGTDVRSMLHQEDIKQIDIKTLHEIWGSSTPFEYRVLDRDQQIHVMESFVREFTADNGAEQYILNSRDVTLRKRAEEENLKLSLVVEQNPSSVIITDTHGHIEYVNPYFETATGYSFAEVKGKNPRILNSGITPAHIFTEMWRTITSGKIWQGEFINIDKNGAIYEENAIVLPIKNLQGKISHFAALKENVTELKKARRLAEQANTAKSAFLSRMSHELRTPLNAINGFSQLMLKSKKNPLNEKHQNMVQQISSAGKHLLTLINEVLDLSSIEAGKLSLTLDDINPVCVCDDSLSLIYTQAHQSEIEISTKYAASGYPMIHADYTRTIQALLNFLSNAIKYNHIGGTISVDLDATDPGQLKFIVADTGIGIAADKQEELFVPFSRFSENQDTIEGTGIGMTITKQLVEKMGGQVGFESTLGVGSTFWFTLPTAAPDPQNAPYTCVVHPNADQIVLYIDDNAESLKFMESVFEEQETLGLATCFTAEDGFVAALELEPKLILLDINLPGIDGYQCLERLKADPKTANIPVIAISVDNLSHQDEQLTQLGFCAYLPKPIDVERLKYHINDVLEIFA